MNKMVLFASLLFATFILAGCTSQPALPKYADDASPVMFFYSDQCSHCIAQKPILLTLADEGYRVKTMDVLAHPEYWEQYSIKGTPTFVASNGDRLEGETPLASLKLWLAQHNAKIK